MPKPQEILPPSSMTPRRKYLEEKRKEAELNPPTSIITWKLKPTTQTNPPTPTPYNLPKPTPSPTYKPYRPTQHCPPNKTPEKLTYRPTHPPLNQPNPTDLQPGPPTQVAYNLSKPTPSPTYKLNRPTQPNPPTKTPTPAQTLTYIAHPHLHQPNLHTTLPTKPTDLQDVHHSLRAMKPAPSRPCQTYRYRDSDLHQGLLIPTYTPRGEGERDRGENEMHDGELHQLQKRNASQSTESQFFKPTLKLNSHVKLKIEEVEKMKSINIQAKFEHFGREPEPANEMHRDKLQRAGFPCDEIARESASP